MYSSLSARRVDAPPVEVPDLDSRPLRIALVSKTNGCIGGASYFAENLAGWLAAAGHEVLHYCIEPKHPLRPYQRKVSCAGLLHRAARHVNWRARRLGMLEPLPWEYWFALRRDLWRFDLIHFHDLHMAISTHTLMAVAEHRPTLLTAHDCSVFTGGCLYPVECRRFEQGCGACPQTAELGRFDFTRRNLRQVRRLARTRNVAYIFPSRWIEREATRVMEFASASMHIPNGFDPKPYRFRSRREARRVLNIPEARKVVVFSASNFANKFKGAAFALRALASVKDLDPLAVLVGHNSPDMVKAMDGISFLRAGFVEDREQLGLWFAAADLLLFPSLSDNLPITIQEAMAARTPVVAFDVGGVPELVRHDHTGWLAPAGDQDALNRVLRSALQSDDLEAAGLRAQRSVESEYASGLCVQRHLRAYRDAMQTHVG